MASGMEKRPSRVVKNDEELRAELGGSSISSEKLQLRGVAAGEWCSGGAVCGLCLEAHEFGLHYCIHRYTFDAGMTLPRPCLPPSSVLLT